MLIKHVYWNLFSFGMIIIMIHRFTLYMQGKWGNQKRAITLEHIFLHLNVILNNVELQRTDPSTKVTGKFSTSGRIFTPNA